MANYARALLLLVSLSSNGCTTVSTDAGYTEDINSVFISADKQHVVVVGTEYGYVLDAPPPLVAALESTFHRSLGATLENFVLLPSGELVGKVWLHIVPGSPEEDRVAAIQAGFTPLNRPQGPIGATFHTDLRGVRTSLDGLPTQQAPTGLNETYRVLVTVKGGGPEETIPAINPETILGKVALIPFIAVLLVICSGDPTCK